MFKLLKSQCLPFTTGLLVICLYSAGVSANLKHNNLVSMNGCYYTKVDLCNDNSVDADNFYTISSEKTGGVQLSLIKNNDTCRDKLVLKDSTVIMVQVLEISEELIRYRTCDGTNAPEKAAGKANVSYIIYHNGAVDVFKETSWSEKKTGATFNQQNCENENYFSINCFPGWLNRIRVRFETKYPSRNALTHSLSFFYSKVNLGPMYHFEYRRYNKPSKFFFYSKIGCGATFSTYQNAGFAVGGIGIGQRNFASHKRFSMELTQGVQFPYVFSGKINDEVFFPNEFYILGPSSILNFNINLVWRIN